MIYLVTGDMSPIESSSHFSWQYLTYTCFLFIGFGYGQLAKFTSSRNAVSFRVPVIVSVHDVVSSSKELYGFPPIIDSPPLPHGTACLLDGWAE